MKKRILVVDDFASIRNFVCSMLQLRGYETIEATGCKEALSVLLELGDNIDLVISDFNMPDGTGLDLLKSVKARPALRHIPFMFLTTESSPEKMRSARDLGLTAWIKKPYKAENFFDQIRRAVEGSIVSKV